MSFSAITTSMISQGGNPQDRNVLATFLPSLVTILMSSAATMPSMRWRSAVGGSFSDIDANSDPHPTKAVSSSSGI